MLNVETVKSWFTAAEDTDELYDTDLTYLSVGDSVVLESVPEEVLIKVVANQTNREYDSYGNSYTPDGFMVFEMTDPAGIKQNFKLPVEYNSYEGWTYYIRNITPVVQREKVVTTWEWTGA